MKDGSQAAVALHASDRPPLLARDMERDNTGGHTGHQGTTTIGGPEHSSRRHLVALLLC